MMMTEPLTQPELGILYVDMVVPLGFQQCVQYGVMHEDDSMAMHRMLSDQKPDTALISLGLCGVILANHMLQKHGHDKELTVLATELKYFSIDIAECYGRAWINAKEHEGKENAEVEIELLEESPDNLNAFGSIMEEIKELTEDSDKLIDDLAKVMIYQAYAHANIAESYVDMMTGEKKIVIDPVPMPADFDGVPLS